MPIFDGQYVMHDKYLYTFTVNRDELVNPADDPKFGGTLLVSACLEISDGSDYYGTTTEYSLGGLLYPTIEHFYPDMNKSSARSAQAAVQAISEQAVQPASPLNNVTEPADDGSLPAYRRGRQDHGGQDLRHYPEPRQSRQQYGDMGPDSAALITRERLLR